MTPFVNQQFNLQVVERGRAVQFVEQFTSGEDVTQPAGTALTDGRTSRSIGHTLIRQFARPARPFVHRKAVSTYTCRRLQQSRMLQSLTVQLCSMHAPVWTGVLQSRMRLCSMQLCSKFLCGRGLTRAAFYQISTDNVLVWSVSGSWTFCLASLWSFIKIL